MKMDSKTNSFFKEDTCVLLFGGAGYEREVSVSGAYSFLKTAESVGADFLPIFIDANGDFYIFRGKADDVLKINRISTRKKLIPTSPVRISGKSGFWVDGEIFSPKLVFPLLHGDFGEDGIIQGLLSAFDINFVGADTFTGAISSDKVYSKIIARSVEVPTLPEIVVTKGEKTDEIISGIDKSFGFPVFVKPARLGSSIGASVAKSKQQFSKSLKKAFSVSQRVMIEPALLEKRELECAYYNVGGRKIITPPAEVSANGKFYDFDLKYKRSDSVSLVPIADVSDDVKNIIIDYTDRLANAISARHIARFDFFLLPDGSVYFNEVNTMPGMTSSSLYSAMLRGAGMEFSDFILSIRDNSD